jgi:hypothetical protein
MVPGLCGFFVGIEVAENEQGGDGKLKCQLRCHQIQRYNRPIDLPYFLYKKSTTKSKSNPANLHVPSSKA